MKNNFVKYAKEATAIVGVAILLAFAYNIYSPKGIPLIPQEKEIIAVSDDELFESSDEAVIRDTSSISANAETIDDMPNAQEKELKPITDSAQKKPQEQISPQTKAKKADKRNDDEDIAELSDARSGEFPSVNYRQMLKLKDNPDFLLIDARSEEFYSKSHIGKAINIFPYSDNEEEMMGKVLDLPMNKKIVIYCDGGNCDSSHKLAEILRQFGFEKVYIYTGGWEDWIKQRGMN